MRSDLVKVRPPRLDLAPGVVQRQEPVRVKAFVAQSAIEAFNEGIVGRLSGPAEVQRDAVDIGPMVERPRDKFRAIVHPDLGGGAATFKQQAVHDSDHLLTLDPLIDMNRQALAGVGIDDGQGAKTLAVEQGVGHEVHRPDLVPVRGQRPFHPPCRHNMPTGPFGP